MRLLLHELAQLLEMGVLTEEIQVCKGLATSLASGPSTTTTTAIASLSRSLEHVETLVATQSGGGSSVFGRGGRGWSGALLLLLLLTLLLFLLDFLGDALERERSY